MHLTYEEWCEQFGIKQLTLEDELKLIPLLGPNVKADIAHAVRFKYEFYCNMARADAIIKYLST